MINKYARLECFRDAEHWANKFEELDPAQQCNLAIWIWNERPWTGVECQDHPLYTLSDFEFWSICG